MKNKQLIKKLSFRQAKRKNREEVAFWVLKNPEIIPVLLSSCFEEQKPLSHKAAWVLEIVCEHNVTLLQPHFIYFITHIQGIKDDQANRPYSKICFWVLVAHYKKRLFRLTKKEKEILTEICFDWLITHQKVACEVFAMQSLLLLGKEFDWVYPELKTILEQNIPQKSVAYLSRGKKVLKEINNQKP